MKVLALKLDYSFNSLVTIKNMIDIYKKSGADSIALVLDSNYNGTIHFYKACIENKISFAYLFKIDGRHYMPKNFKEYSSIIGYINSGKDFGDIESFKNEDIFVVTNPKEVSLSDLDTSTVDISFPNIEIGLIENSDEILRELVKYENKLSGREDQIAYELDVIADKGFSEYFLIVKEIINMIKEEGIMMGPGRGSAPSSLICYILEISKVDPQEYSLRFERFLNKKRVSLPDIDIDIEDRRRSSFVEKLKERYPVYNLQVYNRYSEKQISMNNLSPELVNIIHKSTLHSVGLILSSNITKIAPCIDNIAAIDTEELEYLKGIKLDILPLKALTALSILEESTKEKLEDITLSDKNTYALLKKADSDNIFQLESDLFKKALSKAKLDNISDLADVLASCRPGVEDILYQEELIDKVENLGYEKGDAENIARSIIKGKDVSIEIDKSWKKIGKYLFNKAHAVSYAYISYYMSYFKANYRSLFDAVISYINTNKIMKVDVNWSKEMKSEYRKKLVEGLNTKYTKDEAAKILKERNNALFIDIDDFKDRVGFSPKDGTHTLGEEIFNSSVAILIDITSFDEVDRLKSLLKVAKGDDILVKFEKDNKVIEYNYKIERNYLKNLVELIGNRGYLIEA